MHMFMNGVYNSGVDCIFIFELFYLVLWLDRLNEGQQVMRSRHSQWLKKVQ